MYERKLRTLPVGEIHDAIILDTHVDEIEEVMEIGNRIMCSKRFDWQADIPMTVTWEYGDSNWYKMENF